MIKADTTKVQAAEAEAYDGQGVGCNAYVAFKVVRDGIDDSELVYGVHLDGDLSVYFVDDDKALYISRQVVLSRETAIAFARSILEAYNG